MRTSEPSEQFVTSLKNGKLGVFREQSTRSQLLTLLAGSPDLWQAEGTTVGVGRLEMLFGGPENTLQRVTIKLSDWEGVQPWHRRLNLMWLDWLAPQSFDAVVAVLKQHVMPFQMMEFRDGSFGILRVKPPATVLFVFNPSGELDSLYVDFRNLFQQLTSIISLASFEPADQH